MSEQIRTGTTVKWNWASGSATGSVKSVHHDRIERTIDGSKIVRNGSDDDPALEIEQEDGGLVLKLRSEVKRA